MPALRKYTVVQEVEVKVSATNPTDAIILAERVLSGKKKPEDQIDIISPPVTISMQAREDY